jgi:calcineurin-like phosphoesterase family protein
METTYLVEIRLGRTKWRIRESIHRIAQKFPIEEYREHHPHVTIFGPLILNEDSNPRAFLDTIAAVAAKFDPVSFLIDGWDRREGQHGSVIAYKVIPSTPLREITREIAEALTPLSQSLIVWDAVPENKWFHITVANRLGSLMASAIFSSLTGQDQKMIKNTPSRSGILDIFYRLMGKVQKPMPEGEIAPVLLDETGLRITVLQGTEILAEYDLLEKRWITGDFSHSNKNWQKTLALYRHAAGLERLDPVPTGDDDIFFIADLHLGHANIIRYCSRPFFFDDVSGMDHVLIKNWNYTVSPASRVYFLGDLTYGISIQETLLLKDRLKGRITFIKGNHDADELTTAQSAIMEKDGLRFFLVHDPADTPADFDGWVIHGHHHNNDLRHFPFMDFKNRRINVSAEVVGYIPVSLSEICMLIRKGESPEGTDSILLKYPHFLRSLPS